MDNLLSNKNILIFGIRNKWSIAWEIATVARSQGANLILATMGKKEKESAEKLVEILGNGSIILCDVTKDNEIDNLFISIKENFGVLHGVVHSIAYADRGELENRFSDISREGFLQALEISAYSLVAISRKARDLMPEGGSILTLSYLGAEKVVSGYGVMGVAKAALEAIVRYLAGDLGRDGIRVNVISAGAVRTLSAAGLKDFQKNLEAAAEKSPLKRTLNQEDIGNSAVYFLSDMSKAVTGEIQYVDNGFNIVGI